MMPVSGTTTISTISITLAASRAGSRIRRSPAPPNLSAENDASFITCVSGAWRRRPGLLRRGRDAVLVERLRELHGDRVRVAILDVPPVEHIDQRPVLEQRDRRRRGRIAGEVPARAFGGVDVRAREDRRDAIGFVGVTKGERDAGARLSRRASAYRVDDDHERA